MWNSIKKNILVDYETLLYACFVLKEEIIKKILEETNSDMSVMDAVFDIITHNISRILSIYNVSNTAALKNYTSSIDSEEARRLFKSDYNNVFFINSVENTSQGLKDDSNAINTKYIER
jgi:hypothetical protein